MSEYGSEEETKKEPAREAPGKKFFLSHANSYEGLALFNQLWNKEKCREPELAAHSFVGTIKKDEKNPKGGFMEAPLGFEKFVDFNRTKEFRESILECDVIIYDLMSNKPEEVDYVIKTLKTSDLREEKTLVLLSSVMTWVNTPPKFQEEIPEGEEGDEDGAEPEEEEAEEDDEEEADSQAEGAEGGDDEEKEEELDENGEPIVIKKPIFFKETDFHLRVPHAKFQHLKTLETLALSSVNTQPKLKVHVLCSGVRYGNGERTFHQHFKQAWLQEPTKLPFIGKGDNLVPTIHIIDLARLVRRVIVEKPDTQHPYIFAIDKTKRPTQKRLVQAVSRGIGTDEINQVEADDVPEYWGWKDFLTINLKMKTSDAFKNGELTPEQEEEDDAEAILESLKFPWHAQKGVIGHIKQLEIEFNNFRGLNPTKIFMTGPPAAGKSFYSELLSEYYNVPHVTVTTLITKAYELYAIEDDEVEKLDEEEGALVTQIKEHIDGLRDEMVEAIEAERAEQEQEGDEDLPEVDRETLKPRIKDEILYQLLQRNLKENSKRNRGYIVEGYPRTFKDAQYVFLKRKAPKLDENGEEIEEDEEEEPEEGQDKDFSNYEKDNFIFPTSAILIDGEDEALIKRVRDLTDAQIAGTHYNAVDMLRRLKSYRLANNSEIANPSVSDFFEKEGTKVYKESIETSTKDACSSFKIHIERNEKPCNYMTFDEEEERKRVDEFQREHEKRELIKRSKELQEENLEKVLKKQKQDATKQSLEKLRDQQREILDARSHPIRNYLMANVMDQLADGLYNICKEQPDDPVDTLAEFLFKKSLDVGYPDPSAF